MAKGNGKSSKKDSSSSRRRLRMNFDATSGRLKDTIEEDADLPEPTEQEKKVLALMEESLVLGDDVARASARFLRDALVPRLREGDEQPEEFDLDEFQSVCDQFARLRIIKQMLPLFGLEGYEREILTHFINKAFQGKTAPPPGGPPTVFRGNDEQFMDHMARSQGS